MEEKSMEHNTRENVNSNRGGKKKRRYSISKMGLELKCKNKYWIFLPYDFKIGNRPIHLKLLLTLHKKYHGKYILDYWRDVRRTEAAKLRQKIVNVTKQQTNKA